MSDELWQQHAAAPRHRGALTGANATGESGYFDCGDTLQLHLKVAAGLILAATFQARACPGVVATASAGCDMLHGMTLDQARRVSAVALNQRLGGLPLPQRHALWMFLECLQRALDSLPTPAERMPFHASDLL